jgi:squalene-hopene/tetraprenyl-beta-curcumene cyclase
MSAKRLSWFLGLMIWLGFISLAGCGRSAGERDDSAVSSRLERIDHSLLSAARFLVENQDAKGAWRSDQYAPFRDSSALTPPGMQALGCVADLPEFTAAYGKGCDYLAGRVKPDGTIDEGPHGLSYPVYTAALAVRVLSKERNLRHRSARDAWLKYLRDRQLTEGLGWQPEDKEYGGWGYSIPLPQKPRPGALTLPVEANLSATVFALTALRAAGSTPDDPAFPKALTFVKRRQNFSDDPALRDPAYDDGGFYFIYDDGARNKAGPAGKDSTGRDRFHSYGSMTADGIRGLLACGVSADNARLRAAREWLEAHFRVDRHPGTYVEAREGLRNSVYYYYAWSLAEAAHSLGIDKIPMPEGDVRWAEALADELIRRQAECGSWTNPAGAQREDDPLVATSMAMSALAICRTSLKTE